MISLSDAQLEMVMAAAARLQVEAREILLWRISARLQLLQHGPPTDSDVDAATRLAMVGLTQLTAREAALQLLSTNSKWKEVPPSGEIFATLGWRR